MSRLSSLASVSRLNRLLNDNFRRGRLLVTIDGLTWTPGTVARRFGLPVIVMPWQRIGHLRVSKFFVGEGFLTVDLQGEERLSLAIKPCQDLIDALVGGAFELHPIPTFPGDWEAPRPTV